MNRLIETLPAILRAAGLSEEVADAACCVAWKHAVGEALASHAIPIALERQTLSIAVPDNAWKQQLEQMRGHLLHRLNGVLGEPIVKSLDFRIDAARVEAARAATSSSRESRSLSVPAEVLSAAAEITDTDLRRAFVGAATACIDRLEGASHAD